MQQLAEQWPILWNSLSSTLGGFGNSAGLSSHLSDPIPAPQSISWGGKTGSAFDDGIAISPSLEYDGPSNEVLQKAFSRALDNIKNDKWVPVEANETVISAVVPESAVESVKFNVKDLGIDLQHGVDESYSLNIGKDSSEIKISAETVWGALHALTTFEQLVLYNEEGSYNKKLFVEGPVLIKDKPNYPYRGLMIDTARNFYSVNSILRQLDTMALAKMNVFHWHLTDTQAWPIFIKSFPDMTQDAYSKREVYHPEDMKLIVNYARERGIRVIPELDIPGHSNSGWRKVNKDIIACGGCPWQEVAVEPNPGQLEITNPETYEILEKVYNDISDIFPDNFFHVGFDELNTGCYDNSESVQEWLKEDDQRGYSDLAQHWVDHALPIFNSRKNRQLIMWQDSVLSEDIPAKDIPKNVTMQAWSGGVTSVKELTSRGYDTIVSSSDFVYLDCGFGGWMAEDPRYDVQLDPTPGQYSFNYGGPGGSWCAPYKSWQRIYSFDFNSELTKEEQKHVIGGSAALWSEQTDGTIADTVIWPRTAAYGELLWSGNKDKKTGKIRSHDLTQRILNFRERVVRRGVNAAPLMPKYCVQNPGQCNY